MTNDINTLFEQFITVSPGPPSVTPFDGVVAASDSQHALYQLTSNPEMLDRINAWLLALSARPYINPYTMAETIKQKLAVAGIDFKCPKFQEEIGKESNPIKQFGNPTEYYITFRWIGVKGWYTILAKIDNQSEEL
jgi:hypothetical protein